ncbi:MAG: efflux RND transporter periplasmic adaptor subunit [Granulosicoccus sp.]
MSVEALDRSGCTTPAAVQEGVVGWLAWMNELLVDWTWLGVAQFSVDSENETNIDSYPESTEPPDLAEQAARRACLSNNAMNIRLGETDTSDVEQCLLVIPLHQGVNGHSRALLLRGPEQSTSQRAATVRLCRWASAWLDRSSPSYPDSELAGVDSLSESVLHAIDLDGSAQSVAIAIVNVVKRLCGCQRVSLAYTKSTKSDKGFSLLALSDQVNIDQKRLLPAQIKAAMKECASGSNRHCFPDEASLNQALGLLPAHAALFEDQGCCPSLSLAFPGPQQHERNKLSKAKKLFESSISLVILLERPTAQPFTTIQVNAIEQLLAPVLRTLCMLLERESSWFDRTVSYCNQLRSSDLYLRLNLKHWFRIGVCAALLATFVVPVPHRVSARAVIQAKDQQVIVAPQTGFVATSHTRAGDSVKQDQLLATLDTRELQLSANKWRSENRKNQQALDRALATRDKPKLAALRADATRISAELASIENQLARSELRAPFDGVVLSGDLSQSLGAAVAQGDTLYTIASSDEYELILEVDERDVGLVKTGQDVRVRMAALPNETWHASVDSVLPVAVGSPDANVFHVPALLVERSNRLRAGMEGVAKLYAGKRAFMWVYTRTLREQIKLMFWRLGVIR